ncbi:MAG: MATE family efflux transporter [Lachnospira sp.]
MGDSDLSVRKYEMDMCSGSVFGKMLLFCIPLMLSSILQLLFNAADIVVVGRFAGDNALAAVGSNTALINLLTNFFMGFSIGGNVLVARYFGAKKQKDLSDTVHTAMTISLLSGILLTLIGVVGARQILVWMDTPDAVIDLATTYLRIYFIGMTSTMIYNFGSAILRAVGDTRRPLYYLMIAGIINVLLNLLFVIVFKMSVAGVAIATVVSQTISAVLVLISLIKSEGGTKLELRKLGIKIDVLKRILYIGLPASFQGIIFSLSNVVIQTSVNSFGEICVAGNSAAANIEGFVYVSMNAFHQGAITFTSQNFGARRYERINRILFVAQGCVIVVGLVMGNAVVALGKPLLSIYSSNQDVIAAGMVRLNVISRTYALCGMMDVMVGSLRGLGYSVLPMLVSLVGACGLRLFWIFTFFRMEAFHSLFSLYMTYPVSWTITFIAHVICFIIVRRKVSLISKKST